MTNDRDVTRLINRSLADVKKKKFDLHCCPQLLKKYHHG